MIFFVLILIFLILGFLFHHFYWKPHQLHKWYVQNFRKQGYKVLDVPCRPFSLTFLDIYDYSETSVDGLAIVKEKYPHYDVAVMNLMNGIFIDLINPDLIRDFFSSSNFPNYQKSIREKQSMERGVGEGIVFTEGEIWKKKRRVLNKVFNFDFIKILTPTIANLCDKAFEELEKGFDKNEVEYNLNQYTLKLAGDVMLSCFFGHELENEKIEGVSIPSFFSDIMGDINLQRGDLLYAVLGPKLLDSGIRQKDRDLNRRLKLYRSWGHKLIDKRVEQIKKKIQKGEDSDVSIDLIQAIVKNNLKDKKDGQFEYSNDQIFNEFSTFFVAGFDTVSNYLLVMIYLIVQHPEVQRKVREEISSFMNNDDFSYENLKKMTYIDYVEKEVTRFYGPANNIILRTAVRDHFLKGVPIKKGTFFGLNYMGMHYSEEYYKNPTEFRPERWESQCDKIPGFAVGGFVFGPRSCIGKHLGRLEAKIGLIKFFKRYEKVILPEEKVEMVFRFLYQPKSFETKLIKFENQQ